MAAKVKKDRIITTGAPCTECGVYEGTECKHTRSK